jgi:hypothetical protein
MQNFVELGVEFGGSVVINPRGIKLGDLHEVLRDGIRGQRGVTDIGLTFNV